MREVGADLQGLAAAAYEFLEEGFAYTASEKQINETPPELRAEAVSKLIPKRRSADGYFVWLQHLVWLEGIRETVPSLQLTAIEVQGLFVLQRARSRFHVTHPACPHCGMPNAEYTLRCIACMKEME